jgi:uncharacterized protein with beta-barrel porin domain
VSERADNGRADAARRQGVLRRLLASTSFAALLIGGGTPAALAQCPTVITGNTTGCVNSAGPLTGIAVTNATVTGDIVNNGTISPNGITVDNQSTINGSINSAGALIGGVSSGGLIAGTAVGIVVGVPAVGVPAIPVGGGVFPPTFAGGITNSGTITINAGGLIHAFGRNTGIAVEQLPTFLGGITNSGTITGALFGINVDAVANGGLALNGSGLTSFDGGITNTGAMVGPGGLHPGASGIGIQVQGVSTFSGGISNAGTITSFATGILVGNVLSFAGGITSTGTISASNVGIWATGNSENGPGGGVFSSGVVNGGLIAARVGIQIGATSASRAAPISSFGGGVANSGTITGNGIGIFVTNVSTFSGGVTNLGTIAGMGIGIASENGSVFLGGITNAGTITGANTGIQVGENSPGVHAVFGPGPHPIAGIGLFAGGVSNGGLISAQNVGIQIGGSGLQVSVSSFAGGVSNSGTISLASQGTGILVAGVSTFAGGITSSGTITGGNVGINVANVGQSGPGGVYNGGLISAGSYGVRIGSAIAFGATNFAVPILLISSFAGGVTNNGAIALGSPGVGTGIFVSGVSTFAGGISNGGTIVGAGVGIRVGAVVTLPTGSGGQIAATSVSTFGGGILNSGTIVGASTGVGISVGGISTFANGITNNGLISSVRTGIQVGTSQSLADQTFAGGVANSGTISAQITGISVTRFATVSGGITNTGTIGVSGVGISVGSVPTFAGGITNAGTISSTNSGILVTSVDTFSNGITNSGTIAARQGISLTHVSNFSGGITNLGAVQGGGTGIWLNFVTSFYGGVTNIGSISVDGVGIRTTNTGTISGGIFNAGTIMGAVGIASENGPLFLGGISNGGSIIATRVGIRAGDNNSRLTGFVASTFSGGISNSGLISATGAAGVGILVSGMPTFLGGISNTGTISAATGIWAAGGPANSENGPGGIFNGNLIVASQAGIRVGFVAPEVRIRLPQSVPSLSYFSGGVSNAGLITVSSGAGIQIDRLSTFAGGITNSGTIAAVTGILLGASVRRFSGAIANSGTISGAGGTAIDVTAAPNAITIDQAGGLIAGAIRLSAFSDTVNITGGAVLGDIIGQGTNGTVNFDPGGGNSFNYANAIAGVNAVNVVSGTLFDNNTIAAATVTVNGGATLAPGLPGTIGSLAINGNLAFQPGAFYLVQVGGGGASIANVTGTASLAGTVQATFAPGAAVNKQYDILHAVSGLGGSTFDGLSTINLSPMITASLSYSGTDVFLDFSAIGLGPDNGSINDQNVSKVIANVFNNNGTLPPGFGTLFGLSNSQLLNALTQLDGEVGAGGGAQAGFHLTNSFLSLMLNGFFGDRSTLGGFGAANAFAPEPQRPPLAASAYAALDQVAGVSPVDSRRTFWGSAYGGQATAAGDAALGSNTTRTSAAGFAAGLDWRATPDTVVGFALAGAGTGWNVGSGLGSGSSDAFQAGIYGTQQFGASYLAAAASYAWYAMSTKRTVTVSGMDTLTADFHANNIGARIEAGHRFVAPWSIAVTPYAAAQAQAFFLPAYSESASSGSGQFALGYAADTATATRAELGSWFDTRALFGDVHLFARLAWAHDWNGDTRATAFFQTLPGASFVVNGAAAPKDVALVTAGAGFRLSPALSISAKFEGEFANAYSSYAGSATFRYGW